MIIVGVDPGSRYCGFVVRERRELLDHAVLTNTEDQLFPAQGSWIERILTHTAGLVQEYNPGCIGVETLRRPNWRVRDGAAAKDPSHVIATAQLIGALQGAQFGMLGCPVREVNPGKLGSAPLGAYPDALVSDGERRRPNWKMQVGTGQLRHARSAFDCAGHAAILLASEGRRP